MAIVKALPRNPRMAHLLAPFSSYFTKILVSSSTTACEFLYCLTKKSDCAIVPSELRGNALNSLLRDAR